MTSGRAAALNDAAREPGIHGERLLQLRDNVHAADAFVGQVRELVGLTSEGDGDRAPALVCAELQSAGEAFASAAHAIAKPADRDECHAKLDQLTNSLSAVDAAFAQARRRRATVEFSTEELTRLMAVIRISHSAASALSRVEVRPR
jgi:hypothetical protein